MEATDTSAAAEQQAEESVVQAPKPSKPKKPAKTAKPVEAPEPAPVAPKVGPAKKFPDMPSGLGYAAKRKWLIENGHEAEAEAMRVRANEASRRLRGGPADPAEAAKAKAQARLDKKLAQLAELEAEIAGLRAIVEGGE